MKFKFACFNPPYQSTLGGTKNVDIWPEFIDATNQIADASCVVHPGRWVIPKKQMKQIHDKILNDGLIAFDYYENSQTLFPRISIDGGVTITVFQNGYSGPIEYMNEGKDAGQYVDSRAFFTNEYEKEAFNKVQCLIRQGGSIQSRILGNIGSLGGREFGYKKHEMIQYLTDDKHSLTNPIPIWANIDYGKGSRFAWHYIDKSNLKNVPEKLFSTRKVMIDKKGHSIGSSGCGNIINNIPQIVDTNATASGDVLFVFPEHDTDYELNLIKSYFMTKTVRFLMSITQKDLYVRGFENVPDYTTFIDDLNGQLFSDTYLYKKFGFSQKLIDYIETHISKKKE